MHSILLLALGIGFVTGLRSLTPLAVVAWATHAGWLHLQGSPLQFMGSTIGAVMLSVLAVGELVADKLAFVPKRTSPAPLTVRLLIGGICGAAICLSHNYSLVIGAILGGLGGLIGAFLGYQIRRQLVNAARLPDVTVAIAEDLVTIGLAVFLVSF